MRQPQFPHLNNSKTIIPLKSFKREIDIKLTLKLIKKIISAKMSIKNTKIFTI